MGNRWQASEGPEVIYRGGYYYLFLAYDGLDVPYNTRVARSRNIDGPYLDMNGTNITEVGGGAYPIVTHPYRFNNSPDGWDSHTAPCLTTEKATGSMHLRHVSPPTTTATSSATLS